jgi:flagellar motor switch protein FliM
MQRGVPADGTWLFKAAVYGPDDSLAGHLLFSLDEECMAGLLGRLAPERPAAAASEPVALEHALQLQIHARLLRKTVPLGHIMDLRPGRVIPVNLSDADVLIQDSVLFRATVVEHKGKLCLTSFSED